MPQSLDNLSTTWNSAGTTYNGIRLSVTDTASNAASNLLELRGGAGGTTTRFRVNKSGEIVGTDNAPWFVDSAGRKLVNWDGSLQLQGLGLSFSATNSAPELFLRYDAANTLAQRNGTTAQTFRIYNTFTDASNYERGKIEWASNVLRIGTEKLGTGTARALELQTDGTTRLTIAAAGAVTVAGNLTVSSANVLGPSPGYVFLGSTSGPQAGGGFYGVAGAGGLRFADTQQLEWTNTTSAGSGDTALARSAAGKLVITNGSTGAGSLVFRDAGNIEAGTTTGTKIGTATTQKLAFYNATPVVQPTAVADATDAATVITQLNALLSRMRDLGLIAT